jgi:hypothetical protein
MKQKRYIFLFMFIMGLFAACNPAGGTEPAAEPATMPTATAVPEMEAAASPTAEKISVDQCAEAALSTHQLLYAAQGVCFLYPDNYDVFQGEDGGITLYVNSLLNTEAPLASISFEPLNGRSDLVSDYLPGIDLATTTLPTLDLGGETAVVLDDLPGQDTNRRILAVHDDRVINIMIARIGADYGAVGEQAETLSQMITDSFAFIGIELEAPLLAGPECPEVAENTTIYTNEVVGYCLLVPAGYLTLQTNPEATETAFYVDSIQDVTHAKLFISVTDANGRTLDDVTTEKAAEIETIMGEAPMWSFGYMLDGVPANQFDQVPGQDFSRQVVLVHNGRLYTLSFIPDDPAAGDAYTEMQTLYDTVMASFSFLWQS